MNKSYAIFLAILLLAAAAAGFAYHRQKQAAQDGADVESVRNDIAQFGGVMQKVSLSAPDALAEIADAYAPYASSSIIIKWQANPSFAPGRGLSSPWPSGIEIKSVAKNNDGTYTVDGTVDEITSNEVAHGGIAAQYPVTITLSKYHTFWLISGYEAGPETTLTQNSTTTAK